METQKYKDFNLTFSTSSGEWSASNEDGNLIAEDTDYKKLLGKLDAYKKIGFKRFEATYVHYDGATVEPCTVTSMATKQRWSNTLHVNIVKKEKEPRWGGSGRDRVGIEHIYLATDDNVLIFNELKGISAQIQMLTDKRKELANTLTSLEAMISDPTHQEPEVKMIRPFRNPEGAQK